MMLKFIPTFLKATNNRLKPEKLQEFCFFLFINFNNRLHHICFYFSVLKSEKLQEFCVCLFFKASQNSGFNDPDVCFYRQNSDFLLRLFF